MATPNSYDFLAWFLGPKAENGKFLEGLIGDIVRDYAHWRKNYFPDDPILLTQQLRSKREESQAVLEGRLAELLAALRRNFPFYSPRYIAHELSETLMPAVLGYIAGILYNPNNVTPEAAPVSTELEIEVTSEILEMLGYHAPPPLPAADVDPVAYYTERGRSEFGWAHLTSGGTIANIEALWVARQIKYFPLSVKELAIAQSLDICVKLPNERTGSIRDIDDYDLLLLRPNECIYLLPKLVAELARTGQITHPPSFMADTWKLLENGRYATSKGFGPAFGDYPPKVLVATSAHYSIAKAANILGIGQSNIIPIKMDSHFRLDVDHLRRVLVDEVYANRHVPLCVIAAAGSTEEGVVDPIHSIIDLRADLEKSHGLSFWTHIDAAWGGYIRSLFRLDEFDQTEAVCGYASKFLRIPRPNISPTVGNEELRIWHGQLTDFLLKRISEVDESLRPVRSNEKAAVGAPDNFQFLEVDPKRPGQNARCLARRRLSRLSAGIEAVAVALRGKAHRRQGGGLHTGNQNLAGARQRGRFEPLHDHGLAARLRRRENHRGPSHADQLAVERSRNGLLGVSEGGIDHDRSAQDGVCALSRGLRGVPERFD